MQKRMPLLPRTLPPKSSIIEMSPDGWIKKEAELEYLEEKVKADLIAKYFISNR